jgi:hypothetical protein
MQNPRVNSGVGAEDETQYTQDTNDSHDHFAFREHQDAK